MIALLFAFAVSSILSGLLLAVNQKQRKFKKRNRFIEPKNH